MSVSVKINYSIENALKDLDQGEYPTRAKDIMVLKTEDKFYIGGGCKPLNTVMESSNNEFWTPNISVCMNSPMI